MAIDLQEPDDVEHGNDPAGNDEVELEHGEQVPGDAEPSEPDDTQAEADEEDQPEEIDAQPEKPLSRGERRFQALSNEIKEERAARARLEQELTEVRTRQAPQQPQPREYTADEMALWTQDQVIEYRMNQRLGPVQQELNRVRQEQINTGDKATFSAICANDARAVRLKDEVEKLYASEWQAGRFVPREILFELLLGRKVRNGAPAAREKAQVAGKQRIARQQAPSGNARSDQQAQRGKLSPAEERLKRLENVTF